MSTDDATGNPPLTIPDETRAQFADLVELIVRSESMSDADRQYWINILPIMTEDQLKSLRDILDNEQRQLSAIDAKYAKAVDQLGSQEAIAQMSTDRKKRSAERSKAESSVKEQEEKAAEDLLKGMDAA